MYCITKPRAFPEAGKWGGKAGSASTGIHPECMLWSRFNSLPQGYDWIRAELANDQAVASEIVRVAQRYGNVSTLRRLGWLLEREGAEPAVLRSLERRLSPTSALIPCVPTLPKRGTVDRRWGVVVNGA